MRPIGSPRELERRRRSAVERLGEGFSAEEVAEVLGVHARSVRRWAADFRRSGDAGLSAVPHPGRPSKLTARQERTVLGWLKRSPTAFRFANELWTAPRVAGLIEEKWGIRLHPRYLNQWLAGRGISPQKPQRVPRERAPEEIAGWLARDWPRIKKRPADGTPTSS